MNENAKNVFELAGERESDIRQLDELIRQAAPALKPAVKSGYEGALSYGMMPYKTKSMKEATEWPLIALQPRKNYISLYVCAVIDGQYVGEAYGDRLGKASCGKSCIRFRRVSDLNLDVVEEMLQDLNRRFVAGEKMFGL